MADPAGRGPLVAGGLVPAVQMVIITSTHLTGGATRHLVKVYGPNGSDVLHKRPAVPRTACAGLRGARETGRSPDRLFLFSAKRHGQRVTGMPIVQNVRNSDFKPEK